MTNITNNKNDNIPECRMNHWTSARCVGLVICCGQDGAQVPQHPNTKIHAETIKYNKNKRCFQLL